MRIFLFYLGNQPFEELWRHKFNHVASESVDTLGCPEIDDIIHLVPSGSVMVAVVDLHSLEPVVDSRCRCIAVVAGCHCRHLVIRLYSFWRLSRESQSFPRIIYEVIFFPPVYGSVVLCSKHRMSWSHVDFAIISCYMIRDEINDDFKPCIVCPLYQLLELKHSIPCIISKICIYIIIVADCIWRPGLSFDELRMRGCASFLTCLGGMSDHSCVPHMRAAKPLDVFKACVVYIAEFSCSVI